MMETYTRQAIIGFYAQFTAPPPVTFPPSPPPSPPVIQNPTSAQVKLSYVGTNGALKNVSVAMGLDTTTNVWGASWDSTDCLGGTQEGDPNGFVDYVVYGSGAAQGAAQDRIVVLANPANV